MSVIELGKKYAQMYNLDFLDAEQELLLSDGGDVVGQKVTMKYRLTPLQLKRLKYYLNNQVLVQSNGNEVIFSASSGSLIEAILCNL